MKVGFCSRQSAEALEPQPDWAVISLNEPDTFDGSARLQQGWHSVLQLMFHDTTPAREYEEVVAHMTAEDARQIVEFVRRVAPEVEGILVHCRAGVSRSAAVAKWISGAYRIPFDRHYKQFNKHVYALLIEAGKTR